MSSDAQVINDAAPRAGAGSADPPEAQFCSRLIKDYLQREYVTTREQVEEALRNEEGKVDLRLGEVLLAEKSISRE